MKIIVILCTLVIAATIGMGIYYCTQSSIAEAGKKLKVFLGGNISLLGAIVAIGTVAAFTGAAEAMPVQNASSSTALDASGMGYIAAALSTGLATIGAGYAVGSVGSSALGAVSENPKILGKTLIFVGLAEGIAIYGLIVSILILGRL